MIPNIGRPACDSTPSREQPRIAKARALLVGTRITAPEGRTSPETERDDVFARVAEIAHRQCHPMSNIPGDEDYRREMVPVYVRRAVLEAAEGGR